MAGIRVHEESRWTAIGRDVIAAGRYKTTLCRCRCGVERSVRLDALASGASKSCGCLSAERAGSRAHSRKFAKKHGLSGVPEYRIWKGMLFRCYNPKSPVFRHYGGRGIGVCERWRGSFDAFYTDMGPRPTPKHEIERKDNGGPYSPGNCEWATRRQQARNTRRTNRITFEGETLCITEWGERYDIKPMTIRNRLDQGWSFEKAIRTPVRLAVARITYRGRTRRISEWAEELGMQPGTLKARLFRYGWDVDRALNTPVGCELDYQRFGRDVVDESPEMPLFAGLEAAR